MRQHTIASRFACFWLIAASLLPGVVAAAPPVTINEEAELFMATPGAQAASSVSISGNTAVVGAPHANSDTGQVDVYLRTAGTAIWTHQATLTAGMGGAANQVPRVTCSRLSEHLRRQRRSQRNRTQQRRRRRIYVQSHRHELGAEPVPHSAAASGASLEVRQLGIHRRLDRRGRRATHDCQRQIPGRLGVCLCVAQQRHHLVQQSALQIVTGQAKAGDHIGWAVRSRQHSLVGAPDDFGNKAMPARCTCSCAMARWTSRPASIERPDSYRVGASVALNANTAVFGADIANSSQGKAYVYTRTGTSWALKATRRQRRSQRRSFRCHRPFPVRWSWSGAQTGTGRRHGCRQGLRLRSGRRRLYGSRSSRTQPLGH